MKQWGKILNKLKNYPTGSFAKIQKSKIINPIYEGFSPSFGIPEGQTSDYRIELPNKKCFHIREFDTYYDAHIDVISPNQSILGHLEKDAPITFILLSIGLGGLIDYMLNKKYLTGLTIGASIALFKLASDESTSK
jgi:hypothetical protein